MHCGPVVVSPVISTMFLDCLCLCLWQVFYWGGGKQTPHKVDMFQGGHSALQVITMHYVEITKWKVSKEKVVGEVRQVKHIDIYRLEPESVEAHISSIRLSSC